MTTLFRKHALPQSQGLRCPTVPIRSDRSQIVLREGIRMEPSPVNFHAKKLFQPHIAEVHFAAEMVQQGKLARFVGRFEHHRLKAERLSEAICISAVEVPDVIKKSYLFCALPSFHDELERSRVEPPLPLLNQLSYAVVGKRSAMLLTQFELNFEAPVGRHLDNIRGLQCHVCETFATLDPSDADVRTQVEIRGKVPLCHRDFERPSSSDRRDVVLFRGGYLSARGGLLSDDPASHGDLENGHQMGALIQVALERCRVVTRIERTGSPRYVGNTDHAQIIAGVKVALRWWLFCHMTPGELRCEPTVET